MSAPKRIISYEQTEAALEAAKARNPNRDQVLSLRAQIGALSKELGQLTSDDEKYCNLLLFLSRDFDSRGASVKVMSNRELTSHLFSSFIEYAQDEMTEAILDEVIERLGGMHEEDDPA